MTICKTTTLDYTRPLREERSSQGAALAKCRPQHLGTWQVPLLERARAVFFVVLCCASIATISRASDLVPAPASFIHDETHLIDEKSTAEMTGALKEAQAKLGVSFYVAAYPFFSSGTVRDRALELADQWSADKPGLILVANRGDSQAGIAASSELWRRYPPDETVQALADATEILARRNTPLEDRVIQTVRAILDHLARMEDIRRAREQTMTPGELHLAEIYAAVLMVGGAIIWLALVLWRRHEAAHHALFFPDVEVGTRLGAPFGGGVIGVAGEEE